MYLKKVIRKFYLRSSPVFLESKNSTSFLMRLVYRSPLKLLAMRSLMIMYMVPLMKIQIDCN